MVEPWNARWPAISSYRMQPSAHMSALLLYGRPACTIPKPPGRRPAGRGEGAWCTNETVGRGLSRVTCPAKTQTFFFSANPEGVACCWHTLWARLAWTQAQTFMENGRFRAFGTLVPSHQKCVIGLPEPNPAPTQEMPTHPSRKLSEDRSANERQFFRVICKKHVKNVRLNKTKGGSRGFSWRPTPDGWMQWEGRGRHPTLSSSLCSC